MLQKTYITLLFLLVAGGSAFAQKSDRDYLRSGNKLYNDSLFVKAEVETFSFLQLEELAAFQPDLIFTIVPLNREFSAPIIYAAKSKRSNGTI